MSCISDLVFLFFFEWSFLVCCLAKYGPEVLCKVGRDELLRWVLVSQMAQCDKYK